MINPDSNLPEDQPQDTSFEAIRDSYLEARSQGMGVFDWMKENQSSEYRLWLMTRPEDSNIHELAQERLDHAEKIPRTEKIKIIAGSLLTAVYLGALPLAAAQENDWSVLKAYPFFIFSAWFLGGAVTLQRIRDMPQAYAVRDQERQNYNEVFGTPQ